jgi:hypothetical protein
MTTTSHDVLASGEQTKWFLVREMWASLAIAVMWVSVTVDAIVGPDITSVSPGASTTTIPSAVAVAMFATIATWVVARYGLRRGGDDH